jgi:hypothetical protein
MNMSSSILVIEIRSSVKGSAVSISNQSRQPMSASAVALLGFAINFSLCSLL